MSEKTLNEAIIVDEDYTINHRAPVHLKDVAEHPLDSLAYVGRGYDIVNGVCFDADQTKARVFTPYNNLVTFNTDSVHDFINFDTVFEKSETTKSIGAAMKMNMGFGIFKGEVQSSFDKTTEHETDTAYTCASYAFAKGCEDFPLADAKSIKDDQLLTPAFKEAINDPNVTPQQIVKDYGTHVLANGVVHGARLNFYLSTSHSKDVDKSKLKAAIQASFGAAFKGNGSVEVDETYKNEINATSCAFAQVGGNIGDKAIDAVKGLDSFREICYLWKASLADDNYGKNIASVGTLIGLWEFADDDARRKELEAFITGHVYDNVNWHPLAIGTVYYNVPDGDAHDEIFATDLYKCILARVAGKSFVEMDKLVDNYDVLDPQQGFKIFNTSLDHLKIVYPWTNDLAENNFDQCTRGMLGRRLREIKYFPFIILGDYTTAFEFDQDVKTFECRITEEPFNGRFWKTEILDWKLPIPEWKLHPDDRPRHGM